MCPFFERALLDRGQGAATRAAPSLDGLLCSEKRGEARRDFDEAQVQQPCGWEAALPQCGARQAPTMQAGGAHWRRGHADGSALAVLGAHGDRGLCHRHLGPTQQQPTTFPKPPPSESFLTEPLNYSPALCRSSSLPTSTTTDDFTSFTTATHQPTTWHSSSAPQAYWQNNPNTPETNRDFVPPQADFVLYEQQLPPASQQPQRAPSAPQLGHTFNVRPQLYANSAPTSTTTIQQPQSQLQRPPVPLFASSNSSTRNISQLQSANMADLNSNNSFDSNGGQGLGPSYQTDMSYDFQASAFTSVNGCSSGSIQTVSPRDIFNNDPLSAPPSTAYTNITTPDVNESPYLFDNYDTSPLFQHDAGMGSETWYSLFPDSTDVISPQVSHAEIAHAAPALERTISNNSTAFSNTSNMSSPAPVALDLHRRTSSVAGSPATNGAGITKPRRRRGPLPAITVDPNDKTAVKRARNTLAARESRTRKLNTLQTLEKRNSELEADVEKWKNIALSLGYKE